jgi:ABC-type transporter Mla maintaining outer membrane lipid asymmetry ATPase subunit MlaF
MAKRSRKTKLKMDNPAGYRILVQGALDKSWSDRLSGLEITVVTEDEDFVVTKLWGEVLDQAALFGVLNALYDLHLPLISVDLLNDDDVYTIYKQVQELMEA